MGPVMWAALFLCAVLSPVPVALLVTSYSGVNWSKPGRARLWGRFKALAITVLLAVDLLSGLILGWMTGAPALFSALCGLAFWAASLLFIDAGMRSFMTDRAPIPDEQVRQRLETGRTRSKPLPFWKTASPVLLALALLGLFHLGLLFAFMATARFVVTA